MPETTSAYIHIPIRNKSLFVQASFRTITLSASQGILAVIGKLKSDPRGKTHIQKYMFAIAKGWTMEKARKWVRAHRHSFVAVLKLTNDAEYLKAWMEDRQLLNLEEEVMEKYQPTKEELAIINEKFAKEPYKSEKDLYVFSAMIIDNRMTAYYTRVHPTFLEQCTKDLINGVGFLVGHDRDKIPMARSFKGQSVSNGEDIEVFAKFFMQKDLEVNGLNTDEFMRAFLGGTTEDVSIGFAAKRYECNICGNDVRSLDCKHWPGKRYNEKDEEVETGGTLCFAWVMEPAGPSGEALLEVSAVYKGAAAKAKQKKASEVPKFNLNLEKGKSLKEMPEAAAVNMNFSFPFEGDKAKLDLEKFFAGEYSEEELEGIDFSPADIDEILKQEVSEEEAKIITKDYDYHYKKCEDFIANLKKYPAYELLSAESEFAKWTRVFINSLPNTSFAVIEPAYTEGETNNKNARHLSHHGKSGGGTKNENLDLPHLRNALARMNQVKAVTDSISTEELRSKAKSHLEKHRSALGGSKSAEEERLGQELNTALANNKILLEQNKDLKDKIDILQQSLETQETETGEIKETLGKEIKEVKALNVKIQKDLDGAKKNLDKYKKELIDETLELGIKLNGNSYEKDKELKILQEKSIDDIKIVKTTFLNELSVKFPGGKHTAGPQVNLPKGDEAQVPEEAFKI